MKLTLACICRDEESVLPLMLESAKDIVDEIVVLDTGSTDKSVEIARAYTDKVYCKEWDNSFCNARNACTQYCTGDWILWLDCDERLEPESKDRLRPLLEKLPDACDLLMIPMLMLRDDGTVFQDFPAERCVRRSACVWHGDMHNWIDVPVEGEKRLAVSDIRILHSRAPKPPESREARSKQRLEMAEAVFKPKIEGDPKDRRSLFYLAGTYFDAGKLEEAVGWFERYLAVSDWQPERYQASVLLGDAYRRLGRREDARKVLCAHLYDSWARAEAYVVLGDMAVEEGDLGQAEWWYQAASLKPKPFDPMFVEPDAHTWRPHSGLWEVYLNQGKWEEAYEHGRMAVELGGPIEANVCRFTKEHTRYGETKIGVLVDRGQMDFIRPVLDMWLKQGKEILVGNEVSDVDKMLEWGPDVIWCEWAGPLAVEITRREKKFRTLVRVHGYEVHDLILPSINWPAVDDVIFTAQYLAEISCHQIPILSSVCNLYVVPGGVQTGKFSFTGSGGLSDRTPPGTNRIAMACYGNQKKNFPLALQILAKCPGHELHIATEWQDHRLRMYCEQLIRELGLQKRVFFYPWQTDLNAFYTDKDFYLSASEEESFHYALAEGMAAGLKPVIHCWRSATDFYKQEWVFRTVDEAVEMLQDRGQAQEFRDYAVENLDVRTNLARVDRIMRRPAASVSGPGAGPASFEWKLLEALQSIGFRTDAEDPEVVILTGHNPTVEPWMAVPRKVLWHLEQIVGEDEHARLARERIAPIVPEVDLVSTLNPLALGIYSQMGAKAVNYLSCAVAAPPFAKIDGIEKEFEVGFCGIVNQRRQKILRRLGKTFQVAALSTGDHSELAAFYNKCKVVLNIHYTEEANLETRVGEALSCGACLVTEPLPKGHGLPDGLFAESTSLKKTIAELLADDERREIMGRKAHQWIWAHQRLDQQVEKLVEMAYESKTQPATQI